MLKAYDPRSSISMKSAGLKANEKLEALLGGLCTYGLISAPTSRWSFYLRSPVIRQKFKPLRADDLDWALPDGDGIAVWHSSTIYNGGGQVPKCNVVFRRLEDDRLTYFRTHAIAISRLGVYQPGFIFTEGKVQARAEADIETFEVDYSKSVFDSRSCAAKAKRETPFLNRDYELPSECDDDWLIRLPTPTGDLLINCMEFLVRGYSRRSEIPRILTTYNWPFVSRYAFG